MRTRLRAGRRSDSGQSAVEFALVLPLLLMLILGLLQVGVMVRDQIMVLGAAREGVRLATVTPDSRMIENAAGEAAPGLDLSVQVVRGTERGEAAKVTVSASPVKLPLVGQMVGAIKLRGAATMRIERSD